VGGKRTVWGLLTDKLLIYPKKALAGLPERHAFLFEFRCCFTVMELLLRFCWTVLESIFPGLPCGLYRKKYTQSSEACKQLLIHRHHQTDFHGNALEYRRRGGIFYILQGQGAGDERKNFSQPLRHAALLTRYRFADFRLSNSTSRYKVSNDEIFALCSSFALFFSFEACRLRPRLYTGISR